MDVLLRTRVGAEILGEAANRLVRQVGRYLPSTTPSLAQSVITCFAHTESDLVSPVPVPVVARARAAATKIGVSAASARPTRRTILGILGIPWDAPCPLAETFCDRDAVTRRIVS